MPGDGVNVAFLQRGCVRISCAGYDINMQIDKAQILDLLRNQGDQGKAEQADQELPDQVDTDQHAGLLEKLGINPADLLGKLGGGGGLGGVLGG